MPRIDAFLKIIMYELLTDTQIRQLEAATRCSWSGPMATISAASPRVCATWATPCAGGKPRGGRGHVRPLLFALTGESDPSRILNLLDLTHSDGSRAACHLERDRLAGRGGLHRGAGRRLPRRIPLFLKMTTALRLGAEAGNSARFRAPYRRPWGSVIRLQ